MRIHSPGLFFSKFVKLDLDLHGSAFTSWIRIRIQKNCWIQIRKKRMRIHSPVMLDLKKIVIVLLLEPVNFQMTECTQTSCIKIFQILCRCIYYKGKFNFQFRIIIILQFFLPFTYGTTNVVTLKSQKETFRYIGYPVDIWDLKSQHLNQCCGSGSAWIWKFCLDPDPKLGKFKAKAGSGSGINRSVSTTLI